MRPPAAPPQLSPRDREAAAKSLRELKDEVDPRARLTLCDAWLDRFAVSKLAERVARIRIAARMACPIVTLEHAGVRGGAFLGRELATLGETDVKLWSADGECLHTWNLGSPMIVIAVAPDGLLVGGKAGELIHLDPLGRGKPVSLLSAQGWVNTIAFDRAGRRVAVGLGTCTIYSYPAMKPLVVVGLKAAHTRVAVFLSDDVLVTGGSNSAGPNDRRDPAVRFWDTSTGAQLAEVHSSAKVTAIACSRDGSRIAAGNGVAQLLAIDPRSRQEVGKYIGALAEDDHRLSYAVAHTDTVRSVLFSPDGRRLYSISEGGEPGEGELRMWNPATYEEVEPSLEAPRPPRTHEAMWFGFALAPRGDRIALFASRQGLIEVWALPPVDAR
jgi:WD40 repeat protein